MSTDHPWTEPTPAEAELVEEFTKDTMPLIRAVPKAHRDATQKAFGTVFGMLLALRRQVRELQARPTLKYSGTWNTNQEYVENSLITCGGSLWLATIKSKGLRPGDGVAWRLVCKRGRDGRDLRA